MVVGVYQAKQHFSKLLTKVAHGEQVTITRHGLESARLMPTETVRQRKVNSVIEEMKALAKGRGAAMSIREMIDEGQR